MNAPRLTRAGRAPITRHSAPHSPMIHHDTPSLRRLERPRALIAFDATMPRRSRHRQTRRSPLLGCRQQVRMSAPRRCSFIAVAACLGCAGEARDTPLATMALSSPALSSSALSLSGAAVAGEPIVTVSLTFDDTEGEQRDAVAVLDAHELAGTFYVNSPRLHQSSAGADDWLSVADVRAMQQRGHEIGGHTLSHPYLTQLPELERSLEISNDRRELLRLGLAARSLAYPYGDVEAALDPAEGASLPETVAAAGYASARDTNGFSLTRCGAGPETLPPANAYRLRSTRSVNDAPPADDGGPTLPPDTADTLLAWLDHAAACGGGYLPLIFHHLRSDCGSGDAPTGYCFELAELDRLARVLASGERCALSDDPAGNEGELCYGIDVATVSAALGDAALPEAPEVFSLRNPSLERTLSAGSTECLQRLQGGQGTARFDRSTSVAHSGQASEHVAIAAPYVTSAELIVARDYGACSHFATPGAAYDLALHYRADPDASAPTLRFVVYRLTDDYRWVQWTIGMPFGAASPGSWVRRSFTTGAVPAGTLAISFGLRLESVGGVSVDDFEIEPATEE